MSKVREDVLPAVAKVKEELLPTVAGAVTAALAATEPARSEAASRGHAAFAALKGEVAPPKPKKHRVRNLFLLASVVGAAYAGWKAWAAKQNTDPREPWAMPSPPATPATSTPVTPATTPVPAAEQARPATDDPGGAGPDEALADVADESAGTAPVSIEEEVSPTQSRAVNDAAARGPAG